MTSWLARIGGHKRTTERLESSLPVLVWGVSASFGNYIGITLEIEVSR